ncbi:MAG: hypothetical protein E7289_01980 [Lachnospiraceae bacterium]|nr:hypothetical protein [Lachnospiraceae bacterium]
MAKHILGIASTSYHLMVFLFIKDAFFAEDEVDLVLTDKSPFFYELYKSGRLEKYFRQVFFADAGKIKNPYKSAPVVLWESFAYNPTTAQMLEEGTFEKFDVYDDIFFASPGMPDEIVKEISKTAIKRNKKVCFHRFEDGFASYTKAPVSTVSSSLGQKMYKLLFRYDIKEKENELYLFEPTLAENNVADSTATGFSLVQIPKTKERIALVTEQIQDILQFESRSFDEKYMFLGQGTANCTQNPLTYRGLILDIAEHVGFDNFVVKPHPRGDHDRFEDHIRVYTDTCPFELAVAAGNMEDKTLISYYSTACVSGKLLFDSACRIIFLYPLAGDSFNEKCDYEDYFQKLCGLYENIHIARTKDELFRLLDE